jgi:hypothetical protein
LAAKKASKLEVKTLIALYALFASNYDSGIGELGWINES